MVTVENTPPPRASDGPRWPVAVALVAVSLLALAPALLPPSAPVGGGPQALAVVYPPWWSAARAVGAAARSSQILRLGGLPCILVVRAASTERLRADGAWLFLNPILGGCAPKKDR